MMMRGNVLTGYWFRATKSNNISLAISSSLLLRKLRHICHKQASTYHNRATAERAIARRPSYISIKHQTNRVCILETCLNMKMVSTFENRMLPPAKIYVTSLHAKKHRCRILIQISCSCAICMMYIFCQQHCVHWSQQQSGSNINHVHSYTA